MNTSMNILMQMEQHTLTDTATQMEQSIPMITAMDIHMSTLMQMEQLILIAMIIMEIISIVMIVNSIVVPAIAETARMRQWHF